MTMRMWGGKGSSLRSSESKVFKLYAWKEKKNFGKRRRIWDYLDTPWASVCSRLCQMLSLVKLRRKKSYFFIFGPRHRFAPVLVQNSLWMKATDSRARSILCWLRRMWAQLASLHLSITLFLLSRKIAPISLLLFTLELASKNRPKKEREKAMPTQEIANSMLPL